MPKKLTENPKHNWRDMVRVAADVANEQGDYDEANFLNEVAGGTSVQMITWDRIMGWCQEKAAKWAQDAAKELIDENLDEDEAHDRIFEEADAASIYTHDNLAYLLGTNSEEAIFDAHGEINATDFTSLVAQTACYAREQDLNEAYSEAFDEMPLVHLDNLDDEEESTVHIYAEDESVLEKHSIAGAMWEVPDDGPPYTIASDHPGLIEQIRSEGYRVDDDDYVPPS